VDNFIYTKPSTPRRGAATIGRIDIEAQKKHPPKGVRHYVLLTVI